MRASRQIVAVGNGFVRIRAAYGRIRAAYGRIRAAYGSLLEPIESVGYRIRFASVSIERQADF